MYNGEVTLPFYFLFIKNYKTMKEKLFILGLWCLFATLHGIYDGVMFYIANKNTLDLLKKKPIYTHPHFYASILRGFTAFILLLSYTSMVGQIVYKDVSLLLVSFVLSFSFFHNGYYYEMRRYLGDKFYHFFSNSKTSTGFKIKLFGKTIQPFEFTFITRLALLLTSIFILNL